MQYSNNPLIGIDIFNGNLKVITGNGKIINFEHVYKRKLGINENFEEALKVIFNKFKRKLYRYDITVILPPNQKWEKSELDLIVKTKFRYKVRFVHYIMAEICAYAAFLGEIQFQESIKPNELRKELFITEYDNTLIGFIVYLSQIIGKPVMITKNDSKDLIIKKIKSTLPFEFPKSISELIKDKEQLRKIKSNWYMNVFSELVLLIDQEKHESFITGLGVPESRYKQNLYLHGIYFNWVSSLLIKDKRFFNKKKIKRSLRS